MKALADLIDYHLKIKENGAIDTEDEISALAMTTLNYAAAAQQYFSYNTDRLANAAVPKRMM